MLAELKRKSIKSHLLLVVLLLAASVGLLFVTNFGAFKAIQGPQPIDSFDVTELEGQYVEAEIYFIYDWYTATEVTDKSTKQSEITKKEYVIPIGENEFMGLGVGKKWLSQADGLMEDSERYLNGLAQGLGESFMVKGTVVPMDSEGLEYYHYVVGYDDWTPEQQAYFLPLVLRVDYLGRTEQSLTWFLTAAAALCLFLALWMLIGSLTGRYQKGIKAFCAASESPEATMEMLETFYQSTEPLNGIRMGSQFMMFQQSSGDIVVASGDIIWAYTHTVQHRTNGVPTGKTYGVMLRTRDPKKKYEVTMKNEAAAQQTLEAMHREYPRMVLGYSQELERLYNTDREAFTRLTEPVSAPENSARVGSEYDS